MNKLLYWRRERSLSQIELAAASEVPRYVIQLSEQGTRELNIDEVERLAIALGIPAKFLLKEKTNLDKKDNHEQHI